jgi:uncharacterized protein (TIGR00297 family)
MGVEGSADGWRKAIPEGRDRWQSRVLVWVMVPVLCVLVARVIRFGAMNDASWEFFLIRALAISLVFGLTAYALKAATPAAAVCGSMICLLLTIYTGIVIESPLHSALTPLIALFLLTFMATKAGRKRKIQRGLAESRKGKTAAQVIANLGVAALFSSPIGNWASQSAKGPSLDSYWVLCIVILSALAEATADTVSSEIGQAYGGRPFLLTTFRTVEPGTDGAISLVGTAAGIFAAAIVAGIGAWSMHLHRDQFCFAFAAGVAGLFFDSLLGATVERKGWIGNDLVNFFSTAFAAGVSLVAIRFM